MYIAHDIYIYLHIDRYIKKWIMKQKSRITRFIMMLRQVWGNIKSVFQGQTVTWNMPNLKCLYQRIFNNYIQ